MRPPPFIANFDSAAAMLRSLARFLRGEDFPALGLRHPLRPLAPLVNRLPERAREQLYIWSGWSEAIAARKLRDVRAERISEWVVSEYPRRRFPGAFVGSSNGALVHLAAAFGLPWLPQTWLIPVRHGGLDKDEPKHAMEAAIGPARLLLDANPDLQLHHMHDANHDRLMISRMAYFRVKRLTLGPAYERFLADALEPGATIFIVDCRRSWPTTQVGERHIFQHGALGGATEEEYLRGGRRVEEFFRRQGVERTRWDSPEPDDERPEAEWGFAESLAEDAEQLARRCGYDVRRIAFDEPEHVSPFVADFYRAWYRERGIAPRRLVVESFILHEPWWVLRTGSVPFWTKFSVEPCADWLERYLESREAFDDIHVMLFSHGVDSVGLAPIERWRELLAYARRRGAFAGVDETAFPRDFGIFTRYHAALKDIPERVPLPEPLPVARLDEFLAEAGDRYRVEVSG